MYTFGNMFGTQYIKYYWLSRIDDDNNYSFDWQNGRALIKKYLKYRKIVSKTKQIQ